MIEQQQHNIPGAKSIPKVLPVLPLNDIVLFPKMVLPIVAVQKESIGLIDEAMSKDRIIGLLVAKDIKDTQIKPFYTSDDLYSVGISALILKMAKSEDNKAQLLVQGLSRFKVREVIKEKPYLQVLVEHIKDEEKKDKETDALMTNITGLFARVVELSPGLPQEIAGMAKSIKEPGTLADMVASLINAKLEEKQNVLEIFDVKKRLKNVTSLLNYQVEILELGSKIQSEVKGGMDKQQREYYLHQQLNAIKEELGEKDETAVEVEEYRAKINKKKMPEQALKEAEREVNRLSRMLNIPYLRHILTG